MQKIYPPDKSGGSRKSTAQSKSVIRDGFQPVAECYLFFLYSSIVLLSLPPCGKTMF